ncbi:hypothetical protein BDQ12DRAFT_689816 [Crucibulum laeve]|uniref:Uncharacterized protein n=1 Tax=Crucibulum laeve TaxID=68775 RepID=A0A5C3LNP3_9AGAR|nr:hypothetical protein BDQ12DRAFT_689816 [Crucibulum laeve]
MLLALQGWLFLRQPEASPMFPRGRGFLPTLACVGEAWCTGVALHPFRRRRTCLGSLRLSDSYGVAFPQ